MPQEIEIVRIPVSAARAEELVRVVEQARRGYLGPAHCEDVEILLKQGGDEVALVIRWASSAAHAAAMGGPHTDPFLKAVAALASGPPKIMRYVPAVGGPVR